MLSDTLIVRDRRTKQTALELRYEVLADKTLKPRWEVVTPQQQACELAEAGSYERLMAAEEL